MDEANVSLLLSFAEMYDCPAMKARCEQFLVRHVTDLGTRMATTSAPGRSPPRTGSHQRAALMPAAYDDDAAAAPPPPPPQQQQPAQLSIARVLELSRDFHCHDRLRHVCEAVLMLRQASFGNVDYFLLAQEFGLRLLADICEDWMIDNFEAIKHDKRLSSINHDTFVRIAAGAFDNLKANIELSRAGLLRGGSAALRRTRTTVPAPRRHAEGEGGTSFLNPLFSDAETHAHALFRLQMRAPSAGAPGRVTSIIREYEQGTAPADGSITLTSLLEQHRHQARPGLHERRRSPSVPSTLDTLLLRMRRTRSIS